MDSRFLDMPPAKLSNDDGTATGSRAGDDGRRARRMLAGDIDIRIARDGTWYHEGRPIRRMALVRLFAGILERDSNGEYFLRTPVERRRIRVDDAPFVAVESTVEGDGPEREVRFRTNVDDRVTAGPDHPLRVAIDAATGEPSPYVHVRGNLEALIARPVYYDLVNAGRIGRRAGREVLGIDSRGCFFVLGETGDDAQ